MTNPVDVALRFTRQVLPLEGLLAISRQNELFRDLAVNVVASTKPGREQSLALTALEEACMWATKAIALHGAVAKEAEATPEADEDHDAEVIQLGATA